MAITKVDVFQSILLGDGRHWSLCVLVLSVYDHGSIFGGGPPGSRRRCDRFIENLERSFHGQFNRSADWH